MQCGTALLLLGLAAAACAHDYPPGGDCVLAHPSLRPLDEHPPEVVCRQRPAPAGAIKVACIGDSITAVGHTSNISHHWPNQLQDILDAKHGLGTYSVTNLGVCGTTLQHEAASPWWKTGAHAAFMAAKWDIVDAAPKAQGYWPPSNHQHCDAATATTLDKCNFATTYKELLDIIAKQGPDTSTPPKTTIMIPPPLMQNGAYGMNQTIINTIFPQLVPLIANANTVGLLDVYSGMGGIPAPGWEREMPTKCNLTNSNTWPPCRWYCDKQSCAPGQCHPNDVGSARLAEVVYTGCKDCKW